MSELLFHLLCAAAIFFSFGQIAVVIEALRTPGARRAVLILFGLEAVAVASLAVDGLFKP